MVPFATPRLPLVADVWKRLRALLALALLVTAPARADDWPQWMGPGRDNEWREDGLLDRFPAGGPEVLWRTPIAGGYAGPAVAGGRVFVTDYVTADDVAEQVLFLAGPGARRITGQALAVDGDTRMLV